MGKARMVLLLSTMLLTAFGLSAAAQDQVTLLNGVSTTSQSAVLAAFIASINDGNDATTGISVSNILGSPLGSGFPSGGDELGPLTFYLFNTIGTAYVFSTADHPDVGAGIDVDGNLAPGGTYTVNLKEILSALFPDRVPDDRDFAGYAWVVADFDAVAGTYFNFFPRVGSSQSFQMEPSLGGIPVAVDPGQ